MKRRGDLVVLHRYPYGETSWVLRAIGRDVGVVSLVAKGARRPKSRFSGALETLSLSEVLWSSRPGAELGTAEGASLREGFPGVRADVLRCATAAALCEFPLRFRPEGEGHELWFDLLLAGLRWLESRPSFSAVDSAALTARYAVRLAAECGVGIDPLRCVRCRGKLGSAALFAGDEGGFLCPDCAPGEPDPAAGALRLLALGETPAATLDELERAEAAAAAHLSARLDIPFRLSALDCLKALRRGGAAEPRDDYLSPRGD